MDSCLYINSKTNTNIKFIRSLQQKKYRDLHNCFVVEGERFVFDAIKNGHKPKFIVATEKLADINGQVFIVPNEIFSYISDTKSPQGILGVFGKKEYAFEEIDDKRLLYLDRVQNSDNVGAIIRSAVCAGYEAVILSEGCADIYSHKSVRSSAGAVLSIKHYYDKGNEMIDSLKGRGYKIIGTHLLGSEESDISSYDKTVIILGNEGSGMNDELTKKCDVLYKIRIDGNCESLNVACAATLMLYKSIGY